MAKLRFCSFLLLIFFNLIADGYSVDDYCVNDVIKSNTSFMQFTKEASLEEFGIVGKFKGLHCCAKGYRSIEWVKDGVHYPWPGMLSQFILYPESANQTIYAQSVNAIDAGNYTCILRNDTVVVTHTIQLFLYDSDSVPDDPKPTYISQDTQVTIGESARLFCEAFVGHVDLPDAHNEAIWLKNGSVVQMSHIRQEKVTREDGLIFGTYLLIDSVKPQDFGLYVCQISKPGKSRDLNVYLGEKVFVQYLNPNPLPIKQLLLASALLILILITLLTLYVRFGLRMQVYMKDRFYNLEANDGKTSDVLVVCSPGDSEITLGVLIPTLESRYGYKCTCRELSININLWIADLMDSAKKCRRIVAVISPATLDNKWDSTSLYQALKQLQYLGPNVTCILLKEAPKAGVEIKNSQGETLTSVMAGMNVVYWERTNDERFWLTLRLNMPPKRHAAVESINMTDADRSRRLKNGNHLDDLV